MDWQFTDDRPIWQQLTEQLTLRILKGEYPPGERLPGVRELAAQAGVNPNTMQRALTELEGSGLLYAQRTSGRFVTQDETLIREAGRQMAREETGRFLARMENLGFAGEEILQFVHHQVEQQSKGGSKNGSE